MRSTAYRYRKTGYALCAKDRKLSLEEARLRVAELEELDMLVSKNPIVEARSAFNSGDVRSIVIPVCLKEGGENLPGWPLEDSSKFEAALKAGHRPISCANIGNDPNGQRFMAVMRYAERYNRELLRLEAE